MDHLFWGYKPNWSKRPPVSNARLDTVLKGSGLPVALNPDDALAWLDPDVPVGAALGLLSTL